MTRGRAVDGLDLLCTICTEPHPVRYSIATRKLYGRGSLEQGFRSQCSAKRSHARRKMKYWEIIADNLSKAGWSMGYVSAIDSNGRTIWIADAHCGDGKRFSLCTRMKSDCVL